MAFKLFIVTLGILVPSLYGQCIGNARIADNGMTWSGNGIYFAKEGMPLTGNNIDAGYFSGNTALAGIDSYGGCLLVSSSSPMAPNGLRVLSEQSLEGPLFVAGKLPLLSAVGLDGTLPSTGNAHATYGCGGNVRILETFGHGYDVGSNNQVSYNSAAGYDVSGLRPESRVGYGTEIAPGASIGRCGCGIY